MNEQKNIKDLPPEQQLWIVPIESIKEGARIGLYAVLSVDPKEQKIGLWDKAFKVWKILPNGNFVLKPVKTKKARK